MSSFSLLIGEVFTSPGPRKSVASDGRHHSAELAEDAGGVLMIDGKTAWMWVADGASDMHAVGGFSSRILAQELGREFIARILNQPDLSPISPPVLCAELSAVVQSITDSWNSRVNHDSKLAATVTKQLEDWHSQSGNLESSSVFFEFASTFSAACLGACGHLSGISVGDSYLLTNPNGLLQFFSLKKCAVTLRLKLENGSPTFSASVPPPETFEKEDVNLAALATDGTRDTFQHLHEMLPPDFALTSKNYSGFRKTLGAAFPKTEDDKTFAWLGRIDAD